MEATKIICYANLNSFNSATDVTDEQMRSFFEKQNTDESTLVDVIIDRYEDEMAYSKRDGWNKVVEACKENKVSLIVVPAMSMLSLSPIEVIRVVKEIRDEYRVDFYFMLEETSADKDSSVAALQIQAMLCEAKDQQKKTEKTMRELFREVTGRDDKPSAVPVYVDDVQYAKLEKVAHNYGLSTREMIAALFTFAIVPQSRVALEEHVFGVAPPKPQRGRPTKI